MFKSPSAKLEFDRHLRMMGEARFGLFCRTLTSNLSSSPFSCVLWCFSSTTWGSCSWHEADDFSEPASLIVFLMILWWRCDSKKLLRNPGVVEVGNQSKPRLQCLLIKARLTNCLRHRKDPFVQTKKTNFGQFVTSLSSHN